MWLKKLFTVPAGQKVTEKVFGRILVSSVCSMLLCMACLAGTTWAWFTVELENRDNVIQIGEPKIVVTADDAALESGVEMPAGTRVVKFIHGSEADDLQSKSTLYVTLTFTDAENSIRSMAAVYTTLRQENQYMAEITIQSDAPYVLGWEATWFAPGNADELTDSTIDLTAEEEPNILITSEEFLYGSYFDHDKFDGNTGTRLTSGAYGLIRSADALLPAQDITIRVTDTDLSKYNVTLGYFSADGIYTRRTGILPMADGELTIKAGEMTGAYFRVNVYLYDGNFYKVPESAQIVVFGGTEATPLETPSAPSEPAIASGP